MSKVKTSQTVAVATKPRTVVDRLTSLYGSEERQTQIREGGRPKRMEEARSNKAKASLSFIQRAYRDNNPVVKAPRDEARDALIKAREALRNPTVEAYYKAIAKRDWQAKKRLANDDRVSPYLEADKAIIAYDEAKRLEKAEKVRVEAEAKAKAEEERRLEDKAIHLASKARMSEARTAKAANIKAIQDLKAYGKAKSKHRVEAVRHLERTSDAVQSKVKARAEAKVRADKKKLLEDIAEFNNFYRI